MCIKNGNNACLLVAVYAAMRIMHLRPGDTDKSTHDDDVAESGTEGSAE